MGCNGLRRESLSRLCLSWVKTGKSRSEQLFSDLPPEADLTADIVDVSQVPCVDGARDASGI